jgi:fatty acid desaturase
MTVETTITKQQIKDAIPEHCFERSNLTSFGYVFRDIFSICVMYYLSTFIQYAPNFTQPFLWFIWCFFQGVFFTAVWMIGHECGHQAFSASSWINDSVGMVTHSFVLVPFFAWKFSHASHHANTSNIEKDEPWVPYEKKDIPNSKFLQYYDDISSPLGYLGYIIFVLVLGWPGYLFANAASNKSLENERVNHFEPSSPIFKPRHRPYIIASNIGLIVMLSILSWIIYTYGFKFFTLYYLIPYLWTNAWLVAITYLQHTSPNVKYYKTSEWNFVKGALQTVDRDIGIFNNLLHHITDTHVCHHFFHQIPHYHAKEATIYIKKILGDSYLSDDTNFVIAMWESVHNCRYVEGDKVKVYVK